MEDGIRRVNVLGFAVTHGVPPARPPVAANAFFLTIEIGHPLGRAVSPGLALLLQKQGP